MRYGYHLGRVATATLLVTASLLTISAGPARGGELHVTVAGLRNGDGSVRLALYASEANFLADAWQGTEAAADPDGTALRFRDVPTSALAVAAYHDENGNKKLDRNFLGLPIEGYAFSNDARGWFGPPSFRAAAITVPAAGIAHIHIRMEYP